VPITRGYSQEHRPDLNPVMRDLIIEHQAGLPVRMKPLRGNSREVQEFGQVVSEPIAPWPTTYGTPDLVADSALYREANRQRCAHPQIKWMPRVPAPWSAAQAVRGQTEPQTRTPRADGYRYRVLPSTSGGVEPRWVRSDSAPRHSHAPQTVHQPLLKPGDQEVNTFKQRCRTPCAGEAEAQPALAPLAHSHVSASPTRSLGAVMTPTAAPIACGGGLAGGFAPRLGPPLETAIGHRGQLPAR
jgi:hypothetical protein